MFDNMLQVCVIDVKGSWMIICHLSSLLTIIVITCVFKWLHLKLYIGGDVGLLLGGLKLVKELIGPNLVDQSIEKVKLIKLRLKTAHSR